MGGLCSKSDFTLWLKQRIALRTPTAVVRFGDGEARLLEADPAHPDSMAEAERLLRRETGKQLPATEILNIKATVRHARDHADVLGIRPSGALTKEAEIWRGRLAALYSERVECGGRPAPLASCHLNHEILGELPGLVAGRAVSVISCRDVRGVLEDMWSVEDVAVYQTPSQYTARAVDTDYEARMHNVPIWPTVYEHIRTELTVREQGEIFLVGAGVFGKSLCIRVRDLGGIALDMGSALDQIAGKPARPAMRRMLELHAGGTPIAAIAADLEDRFDASIPQDTIREFIAAAFPYFPAPSPAEE